MAEAREVSVAMKTRWLEVWTEVIHQDEGCLSSLRIELGRVLHLCHYAEVPGHAHAHAHAYALGVGRRRHITLRISTSGVTFPKLNAADDRTVPSYLELKFGGGGGGGSCCA
jgi:hypothetical protein